MPLLQESVGTAGTRRLSGFPRGRSLLWLWPGLEAGGTEADTTTASMFLSRASWSSLCATRCSRLSTMSSPDAANLGLRDRMPFTAEVLSGEDLFRVGLQLVLSDARWEDLSDVGWEPARVGPALPLGGSGSFLGGRLSDVSCAENSPGLSGNFFRPLEFGFETLQLPTALVKRFVCSSLLARSELGVNPPSDKLGELSEQSICKGVCNPKAKGFDSEGSRWTHGSSLLIKLFEGDR